MYLGFRLPRITQADQDLLNLLMQSGQHIHTHRRTGNESTF
jgi:hypothetical protein